MKKFLTYCVACAALLTLGLSSCKSGDDDEFKVPEELKALVTDNVPKSEGWTGNSENGVLKYMPEEYDDEDFNSYFAFDMHNGSCETAVYNVVFPKESFARQFAKMLNDGSWIDDDDDDDDYYDDDNYRSLKSVATSSTKAKTILKSLRKATRANDLTLPIPVKQTGKIIYIVIPNIKGISAADLRTVMNYWTGNSFREPDRVLFGKYENGIYTCNNCRGLNMDFLITTQFNAQGFCTKYETSITMPTTAWAEAMYEEYEESMWEYEEKFGKRPTLTLNGRTVTLDAVIQGDITHAQIDSIIYALDWINNCPILFQLFGMD